MAGHEYIKLYGDAEITKSEIDTYVASNPLSYSIFDTTYDYSGLFISDEEGDYTYLVSFIFDSLIKMKADHPVIDFDNTEIKEDEIESFLDDSVRMIKWTNKTNPTENYALIDLAGPLAVNIEVLHPDLFTTYMIVANRKKLTIIDPHYARKYVLKIIEQLMDIAMKDEKIQLVKIYIYFYLSSRVMNLPMKVPFPKGNVILLHPIHYKNLGETPELGQFISGEAEFTNYEDYISETRKNLMILYHQIVSYFQSLP